MTSYRVNLEFFKAEPSLATVRKVSSRIMPKACPRVQKCTHIKFKAIQQHQSPPFFMEPIQEVQLYMLVLTGRKPAQQSVLVENAKGRRRYTSLKN